MSESGEIIRWESKLRDKAQKYLFETYPVNRPKNATLPRGKSRAVRFANVKLGECR